LGRHSHPPQPRIPPLSQRLLIMNRTELQDQLIQQMLDDMDLKTMTQLCYDYLEEGYATYSDEELITECEEYYPELLEGVTD
jgi:glycerol-3-phosphate cytidylyltransferase-like family protein